MMNMIFIITFVVIA